MPSSRLFKEIRHYSQSRHNQRKADFFVVEGLRVSEEFLRRRPDWVSGALFSDDFSGSPDGVRLSRSLGFLGVLPEICSRGDFSQLSMTEGPQGVMLVLRKPSSGFRPRLSSPCVLILDQVQEPGNVGTILRTAGAAGLEQVWLTSGSADPWSPKVVRSGMGAQSVVEPCIFEDLESAVAAFRGLGGRDVWCAMMESDVTLFDASFSPCGSAIVVGNEGNGITRPDVGRAVTIPMPGHAESLNVAQAATLLLFEALRRSAR